jgi:hypothetical protein
VNDTRDHALAALLDDSVRGIDPSAEERLTAIRRRGSARRAARWVAIVTALAVSLGAVAWAGLALRTERSTPSATSTDRPPAGWRTDQDDRLGLSFRHPEAWPIGIVDTTCRVTFQGVLVMSDPLAIPHGFVQRDECRPSFIGAWVPGDVVIVAITRWEGGPSPVPSDRPDSRFPLSIDDASASLGFWPPSLAALEELDVLSIPLQVDGDERHAVRLFTGPEASEEDVAIAEQIIASIGLIDPCAAAPVPEGGLLTCEDALIHLPFSDERVLDARLAWSRPDTGVDRVRVWVFMVEAKRVYAASSGPHRPTSSPLPECLDGTRETHVNAETGEIVLTVEAGKRIPCPSP